MNWIVPRRSSFLEKLSTYADVNISSKMFKMYSVSTVFETKKNSKFQVVINLKVNPFVKTFLQTTIWRWFKKKGPTQLSRLEEILQEKKKTENSATVKLWHWMTDGSDIKCKKCICQSKKILQEKKGRKIRQR